MSGGTLQATNSFLNIAHTDSTGLLAMSNGQLDIAGAIRVGSGSRSVGRMDLIGGTITAGELIIGEALSATGSVSFVGGVVLIQGDHTALVVSNGCINLEQTLIQWASSNVTDWATAAFNSGALCFSNGVAAGTYSAHGFDGSIVHGDAVLYWDNLDNGSQFTHSGIWVEQLSSLSRYEAWAADFNLDVAGLLADPDSDGLDNLSEYALGGNPTNATEIGMAPASAFLPPDTFEYVYRRRTDAATRGLNYSLETTTNLVAGSWSTNGIEQIGTSATEEGFLSVTNRLSTALLPAQYIRLRIGIE